MLDDNILYDYICISYYNEYIYIHIYIHIERERDTQYIVLTYALLSHALTYVAPLRRPPRD